MTKKDQETWGGKTHKTQLIVVDIYQPKNFGENEIYRLTLGNLHDIIQKLTRERIDLETYSSNCS